MTTISMNELTFAVLMCVFVFAGVVAGINIGRNAIEDMRRERDEAIRRWLDAKLPEGEPRSAKYYEPFRWELYSEDLN